MACPRLFKKLFQNDGASRMLRPDIIPASQDITVSSITLNQFADAGEYIVTGSKTTADGYPEDTTDDIYLKIITTTDGTTQYYLHNGKMLARYKEASSDTWSEWLEFGKNYDDVLEPGTTIYLNASTGDDTLDYGRGLSEDKPFKTLAAAWSYGLNKFYRNNTMLTFKFKAGNYGSSEEYYTFRAQRNITWEGDSDDPDGVVISCVCIGLEQSYNIHFTNVSFKFYGAVGGAPFRVMYGAYVRCDGHLGFQVMSENTDALYVVSVSNSATLDVGYPSEQYEWDITCGKAGLNVFEVSTNSGLQLNGIKIAINGQAPAKVFALSRNCNTNASWLTFTMNAVPVKIASVNLNSQLLLSASGLTCSSSQPVTVDDSSTYTGSAKSPNYNAAIRVNDVTNWESTAQMHNNIYRGANLLDGHFSSIADIMTAVRAGNFSDIYVGDYFSASYTVDGTATSSDFQIAGINLLQARRGYNEGKYDLCIIPRSVLGTSYMNSTNTTAGGYIGSYMYTTTLPKYYKALAGSSGTPFYGYIKTVSEYLSNTVDTAAAARGCSTWKGATTGATTVSACNLVLMSNTEVFGNVGWSSSQKGDEETFSMQLPIFRINPKAITYYWGGWWLRSVAASAVFCGVGAGVRAGCDGASLVGGVRPRFFIA